MKIINTPAGYVARVYVADPAMDYREAVRGVGATRIEAMADANEKCRCALQRIEARRLASFLMARQAIKKARETTNG